MEYRQGQSPTQLTLYTTCLDDMIGPDNHVRAIDRFVDGLDLEKLGFSTIATQGRPPYHPANLLKLFIYGYMNRMRSSRRLELECARNIEAIWLKVARHIEYIDGKLKEHNEALSRADEDTKQGLEEQIGHRKDRRRKYEQIGEELEKDPSGENPQISTSDPDSRHQIVRGNITEVCYTEQTTVDADHKLPIDYKITNENNKKAMGGMLRRAKSILGTNTFTALYDKGYHTGSEFKIAHGLGIDTLVAIPAIGRKSKAPDPAYNVERFRYNGDVDTYTCPQDHTLKSNDSWYRARNYRFKQYRTKACRNCPVRHLCTTAKQNGKIVQRSEFTRYIEENAARVATAPETYKRRQALVEHQFGTMKRQWGFDYITTKKGTDRASADFGLMAMAYNLKRLLNLGLTALMANKSPFGTLKRLVLDPIRTTARILSRFGPLGQDGHKSKTLSQNPLFTYF